MGLIAVTTVIEAVISFCLFSILTYIVSSSPLTPLYEEDELHIFKIPPLPSPLPVISAFLLLFGHSPPSHEPESLCPSPFPPISPLSPPGLLHFVHMQPPVSAPPYFSGNLPDPMAWLSLFFIYSLIF